MLDTFIEAEVIYLLDLWLLSSESQDQACFDVAFDNLSVYFWLFDPFVQFFYRSLSLGQDIRTWRSHLSASLDQELPSLLCPCCLFYYSLLISGRWFQFTLWKVEFTDLPLTCPHRKPNEGMWHILMSLKNLTCKYWVTLFTDQEYHFCWAHRGKYCIPAYSVPGWPQTPSSVTFQESKGASSIKGCAFRSGCSPLWLLQGCPIFSSVHHCLVLTVSWIHEVATHGGSSKDTPKYFSIGWFTLDTYRGPLRQNVLWTRSRSGVWV